MPRKTTTAQRMLTFLAGADEPLTAGEIAEALGVSGATVTRALRDLGDARLVRPVGEAYSGARTWALTDEARA